MTELKTTYKKQLEIAKENNINLFALLVACEVKDTFDLNINDEEFEAICKIIKLAYLKSEGIEIWKLTHALYTLYESSEDKTTMLEFVNNLSYEIIIDEAIYL